MRFAIAVLLLAAAFVGAEEPKSWKGELVLPTKWSTEITFVERIKNESKAKYEFSGNAPVKVIDDVENLLKIRDGTQEGWTPKQEWVLS